MTTEREIDAGLATELIAAQFPDWAGLPIEPVVPGGHDNRTFRLGDGLSIRLPSADWYVAGERKEHAWLARLAPQLPLPIPEVVGVGEPSGLFARPWSVRRWLAGDTAARERIGDLRTFARDLAAFQRALAAADATGGPAAGEQSFHRGGDPAVYDAETRRSIDALADELDVAAATAVWERALDSAWDRAPVWFHGDISWGNLLVTRGRLSAVIDFGTSGVGDPASDLAIAWTLFDGDARRIYRDAVELDDDTWHRARGWTLWKQLITLVGSRESAPAVADESRRVLRDLLAEAQSA